MNVPRFQFDQVWGLIVVLLISLLVMAPSLLNGWVNWDDDHYVLNNPLVRDLSLRGIKEIFSTLQIQGNYHPLTLLSLAADYQIAGTHPLGFHLTNLLLHVVNSGLVFGFIYLLTGRITAALLTGLLFGIHPMHVESVAWISQRKDVLYTCFFLSGLILYLNYLRGTRRQYLWFGLCLMTFVLAVLSKGMAVMFPLILLLIDYLKRRKDNLRVWLEKVPFFLISLGAGVVAIMAQRAGEALRHAPEISRFESLITAGNGLSLYTLKALIPFRLSALHPYPMAVGEPLPAQMYILALVAVVLLCLAWPIIQKSREAAFAIGIYLISLAPVLQLLPVGNAVIAERYTYVAYLGLFFLLGWGAEQFWQTWRRNTGIRRIGVGVLATYLLSMALLTLMRIPAWKNGETLWTDVIEKYPAHYFAYASRGMYLVDQEQPEKAMRDFHQALQRNPGYVDGYINRGMLYAQAGNYQQAIADYDQAILQDSSNYLPYLNRGAVLRITDHPEEALRDLNRSIRLNPDYALTYHNRGLLLRQLGQMEASLSDFTRALELTPDNPVLWYERGMTHAVAGNLSAAERNFTQAIALKPDYGRAFWYRSLIYRELGNRQAALADALRAQELGAEIEDTYLKNLREE